LGETPVEERSEEKIQNPEEIAKLCARVLDESKMEDIQVFHVEGALQITDYFVLASGRNPRHLKAASDEILRKLREVGARRRGLEGYREGKWVLLDFSDVVIHIFLAENRDYYSLEDLWGDCPRIDWSRGPTVGTGPRGHRLRKAGGN
jgi:ribosome-associated protein